MTPTIIFPKNLYYVMASLIDYTIKFRLSKCNVLDAKVDYMTKYVYEAEMQLVRPN